MIEERELAARLHATAERIVVPWRPLRRRTRRTRLVPRALMAAAVVVAAVQGGIWLSDQRSDRVGVVDPPPVTISAPVEPSGRIVRWPGFTLVAPSGWSQAAGSIIDRLITRPVLLTNKTVQPVTDDRGVVLGASLPRDAVVVEIQSRCRLMCLGPREDTDFPIAWSTFGLQQAGEEVEVREIGFRHFVFPYFLVVHVGPDASEADLRSVDALVASIRPDPVPERGEYHGWAAIGRESEYPPGSVNRVTVEGEHGEMVVYLVRGRQSLIAFAGTLVNHETAETCALRYDGPLDQFTCDATGDSWSRFGAIINQRTAEYGQGRLDLRTHPVRVHDGIVLVSVGSWGSAPQLDEAVER